MKRMRWLWIAGGLVGLVLALGGCSLNPAPVANFTWTPGDPLARTDVRFRDVSTDKGFLGGGGVKTWQWDFDDGGDSSVQNPTHRFPRSGDYDVRLTVTDGGGQQHSVSQRITVATSLDGIWNGTLDDNGFPLAITLFLQHSPTGGIGGTLSVANATFQLQAASIVGSRVTLTFLGALVLSGTLDAQERSMSGNYSINGVLFWSWNAMLQ